MADAVKIDAGGVKRCHLPAPSNALFRQMARAAHEARNVGGRDSDVEAFAPWEHLGHDEQDALILDARAMYGALALHARALCESVPEFRDRNALRAPKGGLD